MSPHCSQPPTMEHPRVLNAAIAKTGHTMLN